MSSQMNLDWQKNSKIKVEKALFFIFMTFLCGNELLGQQK
jgi:hypothetical protein